MLRALFLGFVMAMSLFAESVSWRGDYDKAHQEALTNHKPLLVLVAKKGDASSNKIIRDIFMNQSYIKRINTDFVPVIVMYEGMASYPVEMYYTTVFPTLFIVDSSCEVFMFEPLFGRQMTADMVKVLLQAASF